MICSICYERFTAPVSLPCGHIFCRECIRRNVETVDTCNLQHFCPTCRTGYNIATIDPALVPSYLRAHILPPMRPVFFDDPTPPFPLSSSSSTSALMALSSELGRATAEITALRISSETWRRRAEVHAAANAGLLGFARAAKEHALGMRTERDDALGRCAVLQHKLAELMPEVDVDALLAEGERGAPVVQQGPLPVFLMQPKSSAQFYEGAAERTQSQSETQKKENPPGVPVVFGPNVIPAASHTDSDPALAAAPDQ